MDVRAWLGSPLALATIWSPTATLVGFTLLDSLGLVAFGTALLVVTLLAAIGWVAVGFGGSRIEGPFETAGSPSASDKPGTETRPSTFAGVLTYLTVTTAVGWALLLLSGM